MAGVSDVASLELPKDPYFVRHLLERFTFGPRPGDVGKVATEGAGSWFERQLFPETIVDAAGTAALAPHLHALGTPSEVYDEVVKMDGGIEDLPLPDGKPRLKAAMREVAGDLQMSALARHLSSERQLFEVVVDFWTNHFNVFARKPAVGFAAGDFVERAIRPFALGRFADLLRATARHPAMLVYLDNARSIAAQSPAIAAAIAARATKEGKKAGQGPHGLNENYARELMELHTLGVDGGYTQDDVIGVARILTGWSVSEPKSGSYGYLFRARAHDRGAKRVLGVDIPAGGGEEEGLALLERLAVHPSTAKNLARKLCQRFVADDPPASLVARVADAFSASGGEVRPMLRVIAASAEFAAPEARGVKVKSPLRFVTGAVRALGGAADGGTDLAGVVGRLGQPLFLDPVPTGYPEISRRWMNSAAILARMNTGIAIGGSRLRGATIDVDAIVPHDLQPAALVAKVDEVILGGASSERTRGAITEAVRLAGAGYGRKSAGYAARDVAIALAIGSPDFQRM